MRNTYQINNYLSFKNKNIVKVLELNCDTIKVEDLNGIPIITAYDYIFPLHLDKDILNKFGLVSIKEKIYPIHIEYSYEIAIDSRFYYLKAVEYKNETIWNIGPFNIKYVHMLQNYLKFYDPNFDLVIR